MYSTSLLFGHSHAFLGEVLTQDGALQRVLLNGEGEELLGAHFTEWQLRGVPILRDVVKKHHGSEKRVFFQERVQPRASRFLSVLGVWLETRGYMMLSLESDMVEFWEFLSRLPLEPRERFMMIVALKAVSQDQLSEWKRILQDACRAVEGAGQKTDQILHPLRQQTAKGLATALRKGK